MDHAELFCLLHLWAPYLQQRKLSPSTAAALSPSAAGHRLHETPMRIASPNTTYTLTGPHLSFNNNIIRMEKSGQCTAIWTNLDFFQRCGTTAMACVARHSNVIGPTQFFFLIYKFSSVQSQHS